MPPSLDQLAERQWRDYRARTPGTYFAGPGAAMDLPRAYKLQRAVAALRTGAGDRAIGYKVGCTGPGTTAQFGMAGPIHGVLFHSELRQSGDVLDPAGFAHLAIEGEMALWIGEDGAIESAVPVIELHNFVFRAPAKTLVELVANNGLHAGVVLPPPGWVAPPLGKLADGTMTVRINGKTAGSGGLWPMAGGAEASVGWLRTHLAAQGLVLAPGHLVLAGTPLGLYPVEPGDSVEVWLGGAVVTTCSVAPSLKPA